MRGMCLLRQLFLLLLAASPNFANLSRVRALKGHHGDGKLTCDSSFFLSCEEIKDLPLLQFLGTGWHKATYLTRYNNESLVLRVASVREEHAGRGSQPYLSLESKQKSYRKEWLRLREHRNCHKELLILHGFCDEKDVVADVVERIITFDVIESMFKKGHWKEEWWCWPLKWILDILDSLAFAEHPVYKDIILFEPLFYSHYTEFGISQHDGTLKQPDLGPFDTGTTFSWPEKCCELAKSGCIKCREIDEWRIRDCNVPMETSTLVPHQCNSSVPLTYSRLIERFFVETIGRHLFGHFASTIQKIMNETKLHHSASKSPSKVPDVHLLEHLSKGFSQLFVKDQFLRYPSATQLHDELSSIFGLEGRTCVRETFADMMVGVEEMRAKFFSYRQQELMSSEYIRNVIGKPLRYRLQRYPYR